MFKNVLRDTAATRAHAAIINALEVEVVTLRDRAKDSRGREYLRLHLIALRAFSQSWSRLMPGSTPLAFAQAWDAHSTVVRGTAHRVLLDFVELQMDLIMDDVAVDMAWFRSTSTLATAMASESCLLELVGPQRIPSLRSLV